MAVLPLGLILADNATTAKPATAKTAAARKSSTARKRKGGASSGKTSSARAGSARKGTPGAARQSWRTRQVQPSPERYKEIQQALASKGYLSGEASGMWNQESADALRRFQQDQNINASGKIDSLSLIALGLGPKRGAAPAPPAHPEQKPDAPAPAGQSPAGH